MLGDFQSESPGAGGALANLDRARLEKLYDRMAPFYGIWAKLFESKATQRAYERACLLEGDSVLEVAVGSGEFYLKLLGSKHLSRCVGVDQAPRMLARSRRRLKLERNGSYALCRADACRLPFREGTFDALFNFYMLDLFPDSAIQAATGEFRRVLKPSGRLIVLNMAVQGCILNPVWMWVYRHMPLVVGGCRPVPVAAVLAANGWKITWQEQVSQWGFRSDLIVAEVPAVAGQP